MARVSLENLPKEIRDHLGDSGIFALQNVLVGAYSGIETEIQGKVNSDAGKALLTSVYRKLVRCHTEIGDYLQDAVKRLEHDDTPKRAAATAHDDDEGDDGPVPEDAPMAAKASGFGEATTL